MSTIQDKLKNRPSIESVKKSRIWSSMYQCNYVDKFASHNSHRSSTFPDEACFDTDLDKVIMDKTQMLVPKVLVECITMLESNAANLQLPGLYRVSGNHATIQKMRFKIDANNYKLLHDQKDAHNITGIVKLFFRELKAPLISTSYIETAIGDADTFIGECLRLATVVCNQSILNEFVSEQQAANNSRSSTCVGCTRCCRR